MSGMLRGEDFFKKRFDDIEKLLLKELVWESSSNMPRKVLGHARWFVRCPRSTFEIKESRSEGSAQGECRAVYAPFKDDNNEAEGVMEQVKLSDDVAAMVTEEVASLFRRDLGNLYRQ